MRSFKLIRSCSESQKLMYAQEDFSLRWHEKLSLHSHLLICTSCVAVGSNIKLLRQQLIRWRISDNHDNHELEEFIKPVDSNKPE